MNYPKLPVKFKAKWVAALRSGKFKQGKGSLHNTHKNTYCCLGVAARIAKPKADIGSSFTTKNHHGVPEELCYHGEGYDACRFLSGKNDGAGKKRAWTFPEIATWIEKNL